jgi:hypothetical protein
MFEFIENAFKLFKPKSKTPNSNMKWLENVKSLSRLSEDINKKQDLLNDSAYKIMMENKKDLYIPLTKFFELMNDEKLTMDKILGETKHRIEISGSEFSVVEVYPIVENEHIVLCSDKDFCEQHKHYQGNKIKIVSIR